MLRNPNQKSRAGLVLVHLIKHKDLPSFEARPEDEAFEQAVVQFEVLGTNIENTETN